MVRMAKKNWSTSSQQLRTVSEKLSSHKYYLLALIIAFFYVDICDGILKGPPEITTAYLERYVAQEGDTLKLVCPIIGTPRPIIEWYQDDLLVGASTWHRFKTNRRFLKIKSVDIGDSGVFVCKGVNGFGSVSVQIQLVVRGRKGIERFSSNNNNEDAYHPKRYGDMNIHRLVNSLGNELLEERSTSSPSISKGIRPILIKRTIVPEGSQIYKKLGDTLKLECQVDGLPPPTIVWYKDGDLLLTPNLRNDRSQTVLVVPNLQLDDEGTYWCKARNVHGEINATFPVKVYDNLSKPQLLGPVHENKTAILGDSAIFHCAVQSFGPTEIQWLKQLHDHQQPKNPNKTVIVFDYVFEILPSSGEVKRPGGHQNVSLKIGPPLKYEDAGRYICLVNNPEGHAHKEMFLEIGNHLQHGTQGWNNKEKENPSDPIYIQKDRSSSSDDSGNSYLVFLITIPGISIGLVIFIITIVCLRKQPILNTSSAANLLKDTSNPTESFLNNNNCTQNVNLTGNELKQSSSEWTNSSTIFASINNRALMNQSIYSQPLILNNKSSLQHNNSLQNEVNHSATWNVANVHSLEKDRNEVGWNASGNINTANAFTNIEPNSENKCLMFDVKSGFLDTSNTEVEPTWIEVTNKANQTPSHWVYNDITSQDMDEFASGNIGATIEGMGTIFENPFVRNPFQGMAPVSASSAYLVDYSLPKDTSHPSGGLISSVQSSPLILKRSKESPLNSVYHQYSNRSLNQQPKPPSYHSHLSTVSPLRCRSPTTALKQKSFNNINNPRFSSAPPPTSAPPPAPNTNNMKTTKAKEFKETMSPFTSTGSRKNIHANINMNTRYLSPYSPEFATLVKSQMNGKHSDSMSELYSRPPSEHFYFKINDGKTEFI